MKSIYVKAKSLPEAWETAVLECWHNGERFKTEYDKPGDPASRDVAAMIHIESPLSNPRIHRAFPGGLDDLEKYRSEVLYGIHDDWIDPEAGKWSYTYHERLFNYKVSEGFFKDGGDMINQIQYAVDYLKKCPHSRRAQAVTWKTWEDTVVDDPACLQRIWLRIEDIEEDGVVSQVLNMNVHMRSNDAYKASFMNMFAFTELQSELAEELGVGVGSYIHMVDSFHIYGSYFSEFEGFLKTIQERTFENRVWDAEYAVPSFIDGCDILIAERATGSCTTEVGVALAKVLERKRRLENL